jgi:phage shock protein PspC (stress-responsive transcriptional regulator)
MKKTISANIAGVLFQIDEDAYNLLEHYLQRIEARYRYSADGKEIVNDLEHRLSELFEERTNSRSRTVTLDDVSWAIGILGKPEDFGTSQSASWNNNTSANFKTVQRLYRDKDSRVIGGVCSGLGHYFNIDPVLIRVIFVGLLFIGFGPLAYIILWIAIPKARTVEQKLEMHGEPPTPENFRKYS